MTYIYNIKGIINSEEGNNSKALQYYQKGLKIAEKENLHKNKAMILISLGTLNPDIIEVEKALQLIFQGEIDHYRFDRASQTILPSDYT